MKSIVEEASTIEKAIAQAWTRAGKPQKFTITVFQEPEKNFFGLTTAKAKIGFLFDDAKNMAKEVKKATKTLAPQPAIKQNQSQPQPRKQHEPIKKKEETTQPMPSEEAKTTKNNQFRFWSQEMVDNVSQWITKSLKLAHKDNISFSIKPHRYHLKIQFATPLHADEKKEKSIFRSFAHLIMQAQRCSFKKPFKHHKIILMSS